MLDMREDNRLTSVVLRASINLKKKKKKKKSTKKIHFSFSIGMGPHRIVGSRPRRGCRRPGAAAGAAAGSVSCAVSAIGGGFLDPDNVERAKPGAARRALGAAKHPALLRDHRLALARLEPPRETLGAPKRAAKAGPARGGARAARKVPRFLVRLAATVCLEKRGVERRLASHGEIPAAVNAIVGRAREAPGNEPNLR
jgi:hypothetical protein